MISRNDIENDIEEQSPHFAGKGVANMLTALEHKFSESMRMKRGKILRRLLNPTREAAILDLGGGTGRHINTILPDHPNVTVADISDADLSAARAKYGYTTVRISGVSALPFKDREFDLVFCSSVIEHVTGNKDAVWNITDDAEFLRVATDAQRQFAKEIRRVAKSYFVQTPYRYFLIESHTWLPGLIVLLPRRHLINTIAATNRFWPKKTSPDWNLLTKRSMKDLFPDSEIVVERFLGFDKSLIAVRR